MNFGDSTMLNIQKHPEDYFQDWWKEDPMNGNRILVNPAYVKLYGNPFNENPKNKSDIYVEKESEWKLKGRSQNQVFNQETQENIEHDIACQFARLWHADNRIDSDVRLCYRCSAHNPEYRKTCWACLNKIR